MTESRTDTCTYGIAHGQSRNAHPQTRDRGVRCLRRPGHHREFWFTRGSGRLEPGARVRWEWEMYGVSAEVDVLEMEPERRILVAWPGEHGPTTVEWRFTPLADGTFVSIINSGFGGDADQMVQQAIDATEGFTLVLAGLKAYLEHGIRLGLVADRFPAELAAR